VQHVRTNKSKKRVVVRVLCNDAFTPNAKREIFVGVHLDVYLSAAIEKKNVWQRNYQIRAL